MTWADIGTWIKENAGTGAGLVGSLLTGNVPGAVAAGIALVSSATGADNPAEALAQLQTNPETIIALRELADKEQDSIRKHIEEMTRIQLESEQKAHETTQETIRAGDRAEDRMVRWTRPGQSWASLLACFGYIASSDSPSIEVVVALLTLPWAYAGLRQVGKGINALADAAVVRRKG